MAPCPVLNQPVKNREGSRTQNLRGHHDKKKHLKKRKNGKLQTEKQNRDIELLNGHLSELEDIKTEVAAMHNQLKSCKRSLEEKEKLNQVLLMKNAELTNNVKDLEKSFFDDVDEEAASPTKKSKAEETE